MSGVAQTLRAWLIAEGITVESSADGEVLEITIPESADRRLRVIAAAADPFLHFSMVATRVPRARWTAVYPLLSEVNAQITVGAWVLDPTSEMLLYRVSIPSAGATYEATALRTVLSQVARTVRAMESAFRAAQGDEILAAWLDEPVTNS